MNESVRRAIQFVALIAVFGALAFWTATGASRGWSKTSVPTKTVDEVTGIEAINYENRFVPGVDFLAAALLGAGILTGVSFLFRSNSKPTEIK